MSLNTWNTGGQGEWQSSVSPAPVISVTVTGSLTIAFNGALPTFAATSSDGGTVTIVNNAVNNVAGSYLVTFNAPNAAQVTRTIVVEERVNNAPSVSISGPATATLGDTLTLTSTIIDADEGDAHTYSWRLISGPATMPVDVTTSSIDIPVNATGNITIGLFVNDGTESSMEATYTVSVTVILVTTTFEIQTEILQGVTASFTMDAEINQLVSTKFNMDTVLFGAFSETAPAQRISITLQR